VNDTSTDFSIIDTDLTVEGTLTCKGKLIIKGTVRGTLDGDTVVIAKEGMVRAKTRVARITIAGNFEGDIDASQELVILATGTCSGNVVCKTLAVEAKAKFNAQVNCKSFDENGSQGVLGTEDPG